MGKAAQYIIGGVEVVAGVAVIAFTGNIAAGAALIGSGVATIAGAALAPKPEGVTPADPQQQSHVFKGTTVPQKIIYGAMRVSGPLYEIAANGNLTPMQIQAKPTTNLVAVTAPSHTNDMLHVIIPLAGHEVESIGNVIINNELVSPGTGGTLTADEQAQVAKYAPYVRVKRHLGGAGQVADPDLVAEVPEWTSAHIGTGIAYIYLRLKYNRSLYPQGLRNIQADVLGKKVYDPRTGNTAWSDNWALCMRDYMTSDYGLAMTTAEVDDNYIITAANISDEIVATANGGSQKRYTCNGTLDLSKNPTTLLKSMLTAGMGHLIPSVEGKARLIAGAYVTPTLSIGENDLRGDVSYKPAVGAKSKVNTIVGQYKGPDSSWVQVSFPQVGVQAYVTADGGVIKREIKLPFCTDHERCQRMAKLQLEWERMGGILHLPCKITMLEAVTMDNVMVTLPELGFVNKVFRVIDWRLNSDLGVDLTLKEDAASIYAWSTADATPFTPTPVALPTLPTGTYLPVIPGRVNGLEISGQGNNTDYSGRDVHFVWRHVTQSDYQALGSEIFGAGSGGLDAWFAGYEIEISVAGTVIRREIVQDNSYIYSFEKNRVDAGGPHRAFVIAVRILGKQNQRSQPTVLSVNNPVPQVPSPINITPLLRGLMISFDPPTDSDYAGVLVYASTASGFTPDASTLVYDGPGNHFRIDNLQSNTAYYVVVAPYDVFGKTGLNMSGEISTTTVRITSADITPGSVDNIALDPALQVDQIPIIQQNISSLQGSVGSNSASISNEATLRANGDSANAQAISTVSSTVDGHTTTISQHTTSINGIEGQYAVRIDANGHVTGFGLISQGANGAPSTFTILADKFQLVDPNNPNATTAPFSVDANGNAYFHGDISAANGTFRGALLSPGVVSFYDNVAGFYLDTTGAFRLGNVNSGQYLSYLAGELTIGGNVNITGTAVIGTLQLANNAVSYTHRTTGGASSLTIPALTVNSSLLISAKGYTHSAAAINTALYANGVAIDTNYSHTGGASQDVATALTTAYNKPANTAVTLSVGGFSGSVSIAVLEVMK